MREQSITVKLSAEEREWLKRKAYWSGTSMAVILREQLRALICDDGYLRPSDDEPQDFGYEKEMMQFVVGVQNENS